MADIDFWGGVYGILFSTLFLTCFFVSLGWGDSGVGSRVLLYTRLLCHSRRTRTRTSIGNSPYSKPQIIKKPRNEETVHSQATGCEATDRGWRMRSRDFPLFLIHSERDGYGIGGVLGLGLGLVIVIFR